MAFPSLGPARSAMMFDVSSVGGGTRPCRGARRTPSDELIENPLTDCVLVMRCTQTEAADAWWAR